MSTFKNVLVALGFLVVTTTARASFLVEPHLGYIASGSQSSWGGLKAEYTGPQYGARLGVKYLGVMGGFAYTHSTYDLKLSALGQTVKSGQKQDDMGLFVGYNAPVLLRVWVAYFLSSKITQTEAGQFGATGDWFKGKTTEIGVGFTPLPLLSLNVSYRMLSFDKVNEGTLPIKYEPKEIVLGVSVPFSLL